MVDIPLVAGLDSAFWLAANSFEPHTAENRRAVAMFLLPKWLFVGGSGAFDEAME